MDDGEMSDDTLTPLPSPAHSEASTGISCVTYADEETYGESEEMLLAHSEASTGISCVTYADEETDEELEEMLLVGCHHCHMYAMLGAEAANDPNGLKCPSCKNAAFVVDFDNK